jgi:fructose-1,6-bisphosphatase/inositol monophosphatase family enzyme
MILTEVIRDEIVYAAIEAGEYLKEHAYDYGLVEWKKTDDPVTALDGEAEQMIRRALNDGIDSTVIGEEFGGKKGKHNLVFYVDPLDGTKSFIRGEFLSSVSIAAEYKGELVAACVYDFMRDISYTTCKNEYRPHPGPEALCVLHERRGVGDDESPRPTFSKPTINCTGKDDLETLTKKEAFHARWQSGSIALGMAQLASGSYDGLVMPPYEKDGVGDTADIAAGYFLLKQVGFHITDREGNPYDYQHPSKGIIAVRPDVAERLYATLCIAPDRNYRDAIYLSWTESESGWGIRPDGCSLHKTENDAKLFVKEYWKRMPAETPDEYSFPDSEPRTVQVSDKLYQRVEERKHGIRLFAGSEREVRKSKELLLKKRKG